MKSLAWLCLCTCRTKQLSACFSAVSDEWELCGLGKAWGFKHRLFPFHFSAAGWLLIYSCSIACFWIITETVLVIGSPRCFTTFLESQTAGVLWQHTIQFQSSSVCLLCSWAGQGKPSSVQGEKKAAPPRVGCLPAACLQTRDWVASWDRQEINVNGKWMFSEFCHRLASAFGSIYEQLFPFPTDGHVG